MTHNSIKSIKNMKVPSQQVFYKCWTDELSQPQKTERINVWVSK